MRGLTRQAWKQWGWIHPRSYPKGLGDCHENMGQPLSRDQRRAPPSITSANNQPIAGCSDLQHLARSAASPAPKRVHGARSADREAGISKSSKAHRPVPAPRLSDIRAKWLSAKICQRIASIRALKDSPQLRSCAPLVKLLAVGKKINRSIAYGTDGIDRR